MSKIQEIKSCSQCGHYNIIFGRWKCHYDLSNVPKFSSIDFLNDVLPDCPLKESDYWKKELLEWIEKEKILNMVSEIKLIQKIQEMN